MDGIVYACTFVEKCVEVDSFAEGCQPDSRQCLMADSVNVVSDTLTGLVEKIGDTDGLDMDDLFIPGAGDEEHVTGVGYNRMEDADGNEPSKAQIRQWKRGRATLYLADYYFAIERRTVTPIAFAEFAASQIKTH
jgi:hypothetical protein